MKSIVVVCPKCKTRVLPKADGTCPSCQRDISRVKPLDSNSRDEGFATSSEIALERPLRTSGKKVDEEKSAWTNTGIVFERTLKRGQLKDIIESAQYNLIIGLILMWGFGVNWLLVQFIPFTAILGNYYLFLIGYFGSCFLGIYLFTKSANPWISFTGYNLVVIPFGLVVNVVVSLYDPSIVIDAIRITTLVTLIMMLTGSFFPEFFEKIEATLLSALIAVVILETIEIFIFKVHHDIIDWAVALIMCGYIGYDWGRANRIPKTLDNAVDSAAALYMDIVNLFLRILRILGRKRS